MVLLVKFEKVLNKEILVYGVRPTKCMLILLVMANLKYPNIHSSKRGKHFPSYLLHEIVLIIET